MEYYLPEDVERRIPTVADSDGDARFAPVAAPTPVASGAVVDYAGQTKALDGEAPLPETVHCSGVVRLSAPPKLFDQLNR